MLVQWRRTFGSAVVTLPAEHPSSKSDFARSGKVPSLFIGSSLALLSLIPLSGAVAGLPVERITSHIEAAATSSYTADNETYRFGQGGNRYMDTATVVVNGETTVLTPIARPDRVNVKRVERNSTGTNAAGVKGDRLYFIYEGTKPVDYELKPAQLKSMEDIFLSGAMNVGAGDLFCNEGYEANNIERVDLIMSEGVSAPPTRVALDSIGYVIGERAGNNPYALAAITKIDANGDPLEFGPLVKADKDQYGPSVYVPDFQWWMLRTPTDSSGARTNPSFFFEVTQELYAQFNSLGELGLEPGQKFYGVSMFHSDVNQGMDLLGLSDVPLDTSDNGFDCGDHFGNVGTLSAPQALGSIGDLVWNDLDQDGEVDDFEKGIAGVTVALMFDSDGNGLITDTDLLVDKQTTDENGNYKFEKLFPGNYYVVVRDEDDVLDQYTLVSGTEPLKVTLALNQEFDDADFGYSQDINVGLGKSLVAITRVSGGVYDVQFRFTLENLSNKIDAINVQLIEDLFGAFPGVASVALVGAPTLSGGLTALNAAFDGNDDGGTRPQDLRVLSGSETLAAGTSATVDMIVRIDLGNAKGPFQNQATIRSYATPNDGYLIDEDLSDDGLTSGASVGGNPSGPGLDDPTPVPLVAQPLIGIAKEASAVVDNQDGTFNTTFSFLVQNFGNTPLYDVQITDELATYFGQVTTVDGLTGPGTFALNLPSTLGGGFQLNPLYDGITSDTLLDLGSNAVLQPEAQLQLSFDVRFVPDPSRPQPLLNQALATGDEFLNANGVADADTSDLSDDGIGSFSVSSVSENDPTPVDVGPLTARFGLAKSASAISIDDYPEFVVTFTIAAENYGPFLSSVQATDDLAATFRADSAEILGVENLSATGSLQVNPAFDGVTDKQLLLPASFLRAGSVASPVRDTITFDVRFSLLSKENEFYNQAIGTGTTLSGEQDSDLSDSGSVVDTDGDGEANEDGENDPTALGIPDLPDVLTISKAASKDEVTIGDVLTYRIRVQNNIKNDLDDLELLDFAPPGFNLLKDTVKLTRAGADGNLATSDDIVSDLSPKVTGRADMSFPGFTIAGQELVEIKYVMQVTTGVTAGDYYNRAYVEDRADIVISNDVKVGVRVVQDPLLQKTTIIGKVFHDRDGDGHQDVADATGLRLISPQFVGGLKTLGDLSGRVRDSDSPEDHQIRLRMPHHAFVLETNEGTLLSVDRDGRMSSQHKGDVKSGFNNQDLRVEFSEDGFDSIVTITNVGINEEGIPGVRLATVQGLLIETDLYGRYHIADVDTGREDRGGLFIVKVDPATLPKGTEFTTENPLTLRLGKALMTKFNFGVRLPDAQVAMRDVQVPRKVITRNKVDLSGYIPDVRFDSGKDQIRPDGERILEATINTLRGKEDVLINIVGHTDSQRLSKETQYSFGTNYGLGQSRAEAVADYLQQNLGLAEGTTKAYTWGEDKPIATNKNPDGMQQNRRAEINPQYVDVGLKEVMDDKTIIIPHGGAIWATEDPLKVDPRLAIEATGPLAFNESGVLEPVRFRAYSNYVAYIKHWELAIYDERDLDQLSPLATLNGSTLSNTQAIAWDASGIEKKVRAGDKLNFMLRVFDGEGHFDETHLRDLAVIDRRLSEYRNNRGQSLASDAGEDSTAGVQFGDNQLARQTIPMNGSRVRINGADLHSDYRLTVNGEVVTIDENNRFVIEQQMPVGQHLFEIKVVDREGLDWGRKIGVDVRGKYLFMVGLANLTIGQNNVSGNVEPLNADDHYDESTFVDGRAAFYLKGKVKGKYLITAQLDTTEDELKNLGDNLKRKDPSSLLRSLDPDTFYPVYGDDSTTLSDVDTQGAFYVRVEWDKSQAIAGNFHSGITGNEFAQYDRTLYGAQLVHRTTDLTRWGDHKTEVNVFASEAQSALGHNRFLGTGGSLYYLREQDVIRGSEKLWVEIRERGSERVLESLALIAGEDYEIDYIQGRVILSRPLSGVSNAALDSGTLITGQALAGNPVYLMADFEYIPESFTGDQITAGFRGKHWVSDGIAVGGTYIDEDRAAGQSGYSLGGVDLTFKGGKGTWLKAEFASSDATQTAGGWLSSNGGLSFDQIQDINNDTRSGDAKSLEGQINLAELTAGDVKGRVAAWWKDRDDGFSTARTDDGSATTDAGLKIEWDTSDVLRLTLNATSLEKSGETYERTDNAVGLQARIRTTERLDLLAEVVREEDTIKSLTAGTSEDQNATLGAVGLEYRVNDHMRVTASAQTVIEDNGNYEANDRVTVGVRDQINDRLAVKGEVSTGDRGDAVQAGVEYQVNQQFNVQVEAGAGNAATSEVGSRYTTSDGTELYGSYAVSGDRTDRPGETVTLGQRKQIGAASTVFMEERFSNDDEEAGVNHVFGIEHKVTRSVSVSGGLQHADIETVDGSSISRDTATVGAGFKDRDVKVSTRLEYRKDENDTNDSQNTTQWLTANSAQWQTNPHLRWLIRLNLSLTENDLTGDTDAKFVEGDIGAAFRPAFTDRLNMLAKYSYLYDLPSLGQDSFRADEKSHVFSLEGLYDLNDKWEVGGKVAFRKGQTREDRNDDDWYDTGANLALVRTRYHFVKQWDALAEYRVLRAESGDDQRAGGLLGIYKRLGKNLKLGLGYNFTEFDDDLKRLDYDSEGWFIDVVGEF